MSSKENSHNLSLSPVYLSARSAIIKPEQAIPVTLYSLKKWLPRLGPERWGLVQLLRGLCVGTDRRADGTTRITTSWKYLGELLQVHEETIASWLKHKPLADDKPWRQIVPSDDYSAYLQLFIPRLRYAYETQKGKTRRVGFLLEVLMEDPIAPEDEIKLAHQVELLRYEQGQLRIDSSLSNRSLNRDDIDLPQLSQPHINNVSSTPTDLPQNSHSKQNRLTYDSVNRNEMGSPPAVKQDYVHSLVDVISESSDLPPHKSDSIGDNINKLESLINNLKELKHQKRNYLQILEPIVVLAEQLLDDYHSTAMLYKVLRVLFPDYTDLFLLAVKEALVAYAVDEGINRGAVFVNALKEFADSNNIDLGLRRLEPSPLEQLSQQQVLSTEAESVSMDSETGSVQDAIWAETLIQLQGQMVKSTFNSVMQGTRLLGLEEDTYVVQVSTPLAKDWLENRLRPVIERALASVIGSSLKIKVEFRV